jgi:membrane protein
MLEWIQNSYPFAVFRRFFELELLDRSFGLAAQAFVALLPLVILIVAVVAGSDGSVIANQLIERFGLEGAAADAVSSLFDSPAPTFVISWTALLITTYSAFSLSRKLSRAYAAIFQIPSLLPKQLGRGLAWVLLQVAMFALSAGLRNLWRDSDLSFGLLAGLAIFAFWFIAEFYGIRLLVPSITRSLLVPAAALSSIGHMGIIVWAAVYMPRTLQTQAEQFGPIGVTFSLFTLILVGVVVMLVAPLLVGVYAQRKTGSLPHSPGSVPTHG